MPDLLLSLLNLFDLRGYDGVELYVQECGSGDSRVRDFVQDL